MQAVKLVVIGDGPVGKVDPIQNTGHAQPLAYNLSVLISYTTKKFPTGHVPNVFDSYAATILSGEKPYTFGIFDTMGQEEYDRLRPLAYPHRRFPHLLQRNSGSFKNIKRKWFPEGIERRNRRPVTTEQVERLAREMGAVKYVECSARMHKGVKNVFDEAIIAAVPPSVTKKRPRNCVVV